MADQDNGGYLAQLEPSHRLYLAAREKMAGGDIASAVELFEQSNDAFPHFKTLELQGECRILLGQPFAALIPLAASIGLGSNPFRASYLLAKAFADLADYREALKFVDRALAMKADYKRARELRIALAEHVQDAPESF